MAAAGLAILVVALLVGVPMVSRSDSGLSSAPAIAADGAAHVVPLVAGQETAVWLSSVGISCQLLDPDGNQVVADPITGRVQMGSYTLAGTFTPSETGGYQVLCVSTTVSGATVKLAPPMAVGRFVAGLLVAILGGVAGLLLVVFGLVGVNRVLYRGQRSWVSTNRFSAG